MHSCTLSVSLMQGFDASMLPQRNARRHETIRWFLLALNGYHRSEARDFFKRSDLAVCFLRYAHHCRTRLRPLYIDLITDKLISAHPVEAAAESQQSYLFLAENRTTAEPHFQCKAITARGRIVSLQERLHKDHSSEVRSMSCAEAPRCKRTISIRTVLKKPKQEASHGPNLG
jgi:hypothetical protein